jgi:3-phenylpropionate/trans-cinnamate dioxygenase ferredoxin component
MERVCNVSDALEGSMRDFTVKYAYILVANVDGIFYAVNAVYPHRGGFLPVGKLERNIITCPVHGASMMLQVGNPLKMFLPS